MAGRPRPQGGGHRGHRQQTGRDHSSALPCCHPGGGGRGQDGGSPRPSTAPPPGAVRTPRVCTAGPPRDPRHRPGAGREQGRDKGGTAGDGGAVRQRGGHLRPLATPQPSAAPSPQLAALVRATGKRGGLGTEGSRERGEGGIRGLDRGGGMPWGWAGARGAGGQQGTGPRHRDAVGLGGHCGGCRGRCRGSRLSPSR